MSYSEKSIIVNIFGADYPIKGEADPDYIREVAHYVDSKMRKITEESPLLSTTKVAILTALNITDELFKEKGDKETILAEINRRAIELAKSLDKELLEDRRLSE
jgi:cell division protein ZapA